MFGQGDSLWGRASELQFNFNFNFNFKSTWPYVPI